MSAQDSKGKFPSFRGRSLPHFPAPPFFELASKVTQHHFCSIPFLLSKLGALPRFKRRGIRLHLLMGKWQGSRKAHGMGGIVATTVGKHSWSQIAVDVSHVGPSPSHLYNVDSYSLDRLPLAFIGVCSSPSPRLGQVHHFFMMFPLKGFCKQLGGQIHD